MNATDSHQLSKGNTMTTQSEALRALADFIDANPDLNFGPGFDKTSVHADNDSLGIFIRSLNKSAAEVQAGVKAVRRAIGGIWDKDGDDQTFYLQQSNVFGYFETTIYSDRKLTCERRVVGVEDVVVDAVEAAPSRTESREIVEWDCGPLLADREAVA